MSSTDNRPAQDPPSGSYVADSLDYGVRAGTSSANPLTDLDKQSEPETHSVAWRLSTPPVHESQSDIEPASEDARDSPTKQIQYGDGSTSASKETKALHLLRSRESVESSSVANSALSRPVTVTNNSTSLSSSTLEYSDPTPKTPRISQSPVRGPEHQLSKTDDGRRLAAAAKNQDTNDSDISRKAEHDKTREGDGDEGSQSEIQSIMEQFNDESNIGEEEVTSTGQEIESPRLQGALKFPPRTSSLDPTGIVGSGSVKLSTDTAQKTNNPNETMNIQTSPSSPGHVQSPSTQSHTSPQSTRITTSDSLTLPSPQSSLSLPKALPPEPDPEPDLPFDFHRFLEQLRHRTADPVAKFLRSFLIEFGKKQWMVHEQVKIISDFLAFITNKMAQCEVWRGVSDAEFDNAKEGMEKLVMNRLYTKTFSPAIPPPAPVQDGKGKLKDLEKSRGPARRGQHQEDIERDEVLGQKVRIYRWVQEEHLDIPRVGESGKRFLTLAQQGRGSSSILVSELRKVLELLKIKTYRAPRDKVICVLNCCKVIFGTLYHLLIQR